MKQFSVAAISRVGLTRQSWHHYLCRAALVDKPSDNCSVHTSAQCRLAETHYMPHRQREPCIRSYNKSENWS